MNPVWHWGQDALTPGGWVCYVVGFFTIINWFGSWIRRHVK